MAVVNEQYFTNLTATIRATSNCAVLQAEVNRAFASLEKELIAITAQQAALAPITALLSGVANPTEAVTWINNFVTGFLTPYAVPIVTYAAQLTALTAQIEQLISAIEAAAEKIPNCEISIPPII